MTSAILPTLKYCVVCLLHLYQHDTCYSFGKLMTSYSVNQVQLDKTYLGNWKQFSSCF